MSEAIPLSVLTTAVEGGIGYWCRIMRAVRVRRGGLDGYYKAIILVTEAALEAAETDSWYDIDSLYGDDEGLVRLAPFTYAVTSEDVLSAALSLDAKPSTFGDYHRLAIHDIAIANPAVDFDSETADILVQHACFGEVKYG